MRQSEHLVRDFPRRVATLVTTMVLGSTVVPIHLLAAPLVAFLVTEVAQQAFRIRLLRGVDGWVRPAFVVNGVLAGALFSIFPSLLWHSGTPAGQVMGIGMMLTGIVHCILVRSHHLGMGLATMAPILAALAFAVWPHVLPVSGASGDAAQTPTAIWATAVYVAICFAYLVHAAMDQNREKRRMARALREAEAAVRAKGRFLTSMSHEIRTPLNGILGIAQINRDAATTREERELAETLVASSRILKSMVDDILDHAKIEAGKMELALTPVDLAQLCREVLALFATEAQSKDLALTLDVAPDLPPLVEADRLRLHQIVANLVSNAVKFTPSGEVGIEVRATPEREGRALVEIAVRDNGRGLSEDEIEILFDAFTQVGDEAEMAAKGTGLGLTISQSLAALMNGAIEVESAPGAGSAFALRFPARVFFGAAPASKARQGDPAAVPDLEGLRILLVDDNRTNRMVIKAFLKDTGAAITEAGDGAEAVETSAAAYFDVILLDIRMPVMDGEEAFERMRAAGMDAHVIALTANTMPEDRARYLALGMNGYLAKPISKTALLRARAEAPPRLEEAA